MIPTPNKENNEENNNNDNNENNNNEENITTNEKNKDIKRCEDGSYENIIGNEEITTNNNNIYNNREANGREIFDAKDLSNINPMNAMNEISVDVPFGENEEKKKKPEFLDDDLDDKIKKDDKGVEIDKNEEEKKLEEKHNEDIEKKSNDEKEEKEDKKEENEEKEKKDEKEENKEQDKMEILNNIINNEPKDEDIELEQLEEFQI